MPPMVGSTVPDPDSEVVGEPLKKQRMSEPLTEGYPGPLKCKLLSEHAVAPVRSSADAAGYDLTAAESKAIPARGKALIKTNVAVAIAPGYYGRVAPRSSLAWKHHLDCGAGVIDADYRGDVGVVLFNHAGTDFQVEKGMRIAQLIIQKIETPETQIVDDLDDTARGAGGYGSTGK
eukprot:gnl/MRDRNA2_/MRDRNA2_88525_c0_seq1.p1 gnl/MRDRNA2_/MRDRNA2_88525_c0~~gnl/MRDRNA2_/MRDRNA2_88525_c0_seq1.p1  ORF type:complete len:176 (-),score=46.17 gnl/MRDRNA2_/MRDRNA2_88525_c0_seq1:225-752(-)